MQRLYVFIVFLFVFLSKTDKDIQSHSFELVGVRRKE